MERSWPFLNRSARRGECFPIEVGENHGHNLGAARPAQVLAGVDVIGGTIQRSYNGRDVWEDCSEVREQYKRLRREVSRHHKWRLRKALARYGQ